MVPVELALLAWIPISLLLMLDRDNARGFSIAVFGGMLFLPSGDDSIVNMPILPSLDKDNVAFVGILLGTILFHPRIFDRFVLTWADLVLVAVGLLAFASSMLNGFGAYGGASKTLEFGFNFLFPVVLARLHLGTPHGIRTFFLVMIGAAAIYAPLALWEFRMSPQVHTSVYGFFQHHFAQHYRGGFWRPIVFFYHALALGRFFAFAAFLALLPMRKDLEGILGPIGRYVFLLPLAGLLASMSLSPIFLFCALSVGYLFIERYDWALYALPAVAIAWFILVMVGFDFGMGASGRLSMLSQERGQSLNYRFQALQEYRGMVRYKPILGYAGWGAGRIQGRATDSQSLITVLNRGFVGWMLFYAWWLYALHVAIQLRRATTGTVFAQRAAAVALLCSIAIAFTMIDAAFDEQLLLALSGMMGVQLWLGQLPQTRTPKPDNVAPPLPAEQRGQTA